MTPVSNDQIGKGRCCASVGRTAHSDHTVGVLPNFLRAAPAAANSPVPNSMIEPGSGIGAPVGSKVLIDTISPNEPTRVDWPDVWLMRGSMYPDAFVRITRMVLFIAGHGLPLVQVLRPGKSVTDPSLVKLKSTCDVNARPFGVAPPLVGVTH